MRVKQLPFRVLLLTLLAVAALALAACGPRDEPAAAGTTEEQATEEQAATTDEAAEASAETAAEEPAATSQEVITEVVEQSGAAQSSEVKGVTVTTDEPDVSAQRTEYGGDYRDVATSDAVSFHPYLTTDTGSSAYQAMVYAYQLLRLDENTLEYIPDMAESYTVSDDGLTFTFNLRHDMKWSDGQPLTAQDYKWTYDQVIKPENEFPYLSQLEFIQSYEALDDYTIQIKIKEVYAPALGQMVGLITPLPKHIWENLDWKDPEKNPEINNPSVVSGPYKVKEWKRDQYIVFEANPDYWYHGRPNFDSNSIEIVPDSDIAYQKMKSGESDTGVITPENLEEAEKLDNINVYRWWPAAARWSYIGLNMREGFATHDINVRHAINYAIDKQELTDEVMLGTAKRQCSVFPETSWVYNPDVPCYDFDPEAAKAAFAEAGYTYDEGSNQMLDADGNQLSLKLIYGPNTNKVRELMAVVVQDYLSKIGVDVEVQALEWASFLDAIHAEEPDWDMYIGGWASTIEPHIMYTIWAEESIPDLNSVGYINPEVEALFKEGGATYDQAVRKEKYGEVQRIIAEEAPYVFLFYQETWSGQNERIQGIEPTALGIGWNAEDWYIEATPN